MAESSIPLIDTSAQPLSNVVTAVSEAFKLNNNTTANPKNMDAATLTSPSTNHRLTLTFNRDLPISFSTVQHTSDRTDHHISTTQKTITVNNRIQPPLSSVIFRFSFHLILCYDLWLMLTWSCEVIYFEKIDFLKLDIGDGSWRIWL